MLARISKSEIELAQHLLLDCCDLGVLEQILSREEVYLGFQNELIELPDSKKKIRIAEIIVHLLGDNLLNSNLVREAIAESKRTSFLVNWKPGSANAVKFCKKIDLPEVFAGTLPTPKPPAVERLHSIQDYPVLTDYQKEVYDIAIDSLNNNKSALVTLPTGAGKTLVATNIVVDWHRENKNGITTIWLAHSEELCEQAVECLKQTWDGKLGPTPAVIYRAWGNHTKKITNGEVFQDAESGNTNEVIHSIIVTTPITALRILENKLNGSISKSLSGLNLLVIDEAHRAASPSYRNVIREAGKFSNENINLIGLSATPIRETYASKKYEGTQELAKLFGKLIEPVNTLGEFSSPIVALQNMGILANLEVNKIDCDDKSDKKIAEVICNNWSDDSGPALLFTSTVSSSKVITTLLRENGIAAEYVTGKSTSVERYNIVAGLKNGSIDILSNCEILTTGFDAPSVKTIYLARHTNSPVLYKQIVGRGLRGASFGGSPTCKLFLCGIDLPFDADPNTSEFARTVWSLKS